ncbi:MAG: hypothetical protein PUD93_08860 [Lachnospiraceae bacterium]|nr:hypothetical protein [Lachnospiraceae bacterium]
MQMMEQEYRISCMPKKDENGKVKVSDIKFRTNSESIIPYIEVNFDASKHNIVKSIIVGPKSNMNNRNLWLLMKSQGFKWVEQGEDWTLDDRRWQQHVKISKATYR